MVTNYCKDVIESKEVFENFLKSSNKTDVVDFYNKCVDWGYGTQYDGDAYFSSKVYALNEENIKLLAEEYGATYYDDISDVEYNIVEHPDLIFKKDDCNREDEFVTYFSPEGLITLNFCDLLECLLEDYELIKHLIAAV